MGSAYDFNLLMYFLALRIGTRCLLYLAITVPLFPLCLPYSPFVSSSVSFCSCLQLLLGLVSSSAPPLNALEFYCSEKNAKACGYQRVCQET